MPTTKRRASSIAPPTASTPFDFAADQAFRQDQIAIDPKTAQPITRIIRFHGPSRLAGFVQNDWKARPNLSINAGLRYEGI